MLADATLASYVGTRIFSRRPVPIGTAYPFIEIADITSTAHRVVNQVVTGTEELCQVQTWADATTSMATLEAVMDRVRAVLHRASGSIAGASVLI